MQYITHVFNRHEIKYMITQEQYRKLLDGIRDYMLPDPHGESTICNIYYDTPDDRLVRKSLEGPVYKEKIRLRSYGTAKDDSIVFLELKKKYDHVVYKRRVQVTEAEGLQPCSVEMSPLDRQIMREIGFTLSRYPELEPACLISCDREAWCGREDRDLRITFDWNILWRDTELDLCKGRQGRSLLTSSEVLMEIKTSRAIPLWLTNFLSSEKIYKRSFSKYGKAYEAQLADTAKAPMLNPGFYQQSEGGKIYGFHFSGAF